MKAKVLLMMLLSLMAIKTWAVEPDMLVLQTGESLKVYNVEVVNGKVFYTLSEKEDATIKKVATSDVLVIRRADGQVMNPNAQAYTPTKAEKSASVVTNPHAHADVTMTATEPIKTKNGVSTIIVPDLVGNKVRYRVTNTNTKELAITEDGDGINYHKQSESYQFPEYIIIEDEKYTVTSVDKDAFLASNIRYSKIKNIRLPNTLEVIGNGAFWWLVHLEEIVIPDNVKQIDQDAFYSAGMLCNDFKYIHLPSNLQKVGSKAFKFAGYPRSFGGHYQGSLNSIPSWMDTDNCHDFGIDDNAVEAYYKRKNQ